MNYKKITLLIAALGIITTNMSLCKGGGGGGHFSGGGGHMGGFGGGHAISGSSMGSSHSAISSGARASHATPSHTIQRDAGQHYYGHKGNVHHHHYYGYPYWTGYGPWLDDWYYDYDPYALDEYYYSDEDEDDEDYD